MVTKKFMKNNHPHQCPAVTVGNLNLLRALGRGAFPVIAATSIANEVAFYSKYKHRAYRIPGPTKTPIEFIQALIDIGKELENKKPVLFYDADADLLCISRSRKKLEKYYRFNMPPNSVIESLVDKSKFIRYAHEHELPIPYARLIQSYEDAENQSSDKITLPVIVKPVTRVDWFDSELAKVFGKGGKAILIKNQQELEKMVTFSKEFNIGIVIQKLIPGDESRILSYHSYVDKNGNVLGEYTGKKHRTFPSQFGMSTCVEVCDFPDVVSAGREILEKTGLTGILKIDFKKDPLTGKLFLLEINPRFNIWNYPAAVAGVNLPTIAYYDIVGEKPDFDIRVNKNVKWIDAARDLKMYKEIGRSYEFYYRTCLNILNNKVVFTLWAWSDPVPFLWYAMNRFWQYINSKSKKVIGYILKSPGNQL